MYQVGLLDEADRELAKLDESIALRVVKRTQWLAENIDVIKREPLKGHLAGFYKLRVGDFRVVYEVLQAEEKIIIHQIGHRSEIYRPR